MSAVRGRSTQGLAAAAACAAVAALAPAAGGHSGHPVRPAQSSEIAGRSTLEQTLRARDEGQPFTFLTTGPGESHVVREEGIGTARDGRADRRVSLAYFGQLTDFQVTDEESPARVEFVDVTANPPFPSTFSAAWRPQEALVAHGVDLAIRNMNRFLTSPVSQRDGERARMAFALMTGDLADNQHLNESEWVRILLEGGRLDPNSGSSDPADYSGCPPGTPGTDEAARYTGVQDYDDYVEGNQYYDPDVPAGPWSAWPRYPGLMDRAQAAFEAEGLRVPSYVTFGNHDGLAQGNAAAIRPYEDIGTGCVKPLVPATNQTEPMAALDPTFAASLVTSDPTKVMLVPPDPKRRYVDKAEFKALYAAGRQADAHGFAFVDRAENDASNGAAAYYAWDPIPGMRFISIDTLSEGGIPGPSSNGNLDDPQWQWLRRELEAAQRANKLIVLFGHHPIRSLSADLPDELAPPCTARDSHGHDVNPGCDRDPRSSTPIHLGPDLEELLKSHRNVIAFVAGHTHENKVTPFAREGGGGFWGIETPSIVDWPPQTRLLEVMDNRDGTLSIFGTLLNTEAPPTSPPSETAQGGASPAALASIGRTLSFNDPQAGAGTGEGTRADRNVELLIADPRARADGGDDDSDGGGDNGSGDRDRDDASDDDEERGTTVGGSQSTTAGTRRLPFTGLAIALLAAAGLALGGGGAWLRHHARRGG